MFQSSLSFVEIVGTKLSALGIHRGGFSVDGCDSRSLRLQLCAQVSLRSFLRWQHDKKYAAHHPLDLRHSWPTSPDSTTTKPTSALCCKSGEGERGEEGSEAEPEEGSDGLRLVASFRLVG